MTDGGKFGRFSAKRGSNSPRLAVPPLIMTASRQSAGLHMGLDVPWRENRRGGALVFAGKPVVNEDRR